MARNHNQPPREWLRTQSGALVSPLALTPLARELGLQLEPAGRPRGGIRRQISQLRSINARATLARAIARRDVPMEHPEGGADSPFDENYLRELAEKHAQEIIAIQDTAVFTLAKVAESRDQATGGHLMRIRAYSRILAEQLAREGPYRDEVGGQFLQDLCRSSPLHDIGKVGIRDEILLAPGRLGAADFRAMQQHTIIGSNILDQAVARLEGGGFLAVGVLIARFHHERFDGGGYPAGLVGREIPLAARIVAVADVYDALTSVRPYKPAYPPIAAKSIIRRNSGRHFDPVIVRAFCRRFDDFLLAQEEAAEEFPVHYGAMAFSQYDLAAAGS